jgi:hypothetical protein
MVGRLGRRLRSARLLGKRRSALDITQHGRAFAVAGAPEQEHAEPTVMLCHLRISDVVAGELIGIVER